MLFWYLIFILTIILLYLCASFNAKGSMPICYGIFDYSLTSLVLVYALLHMCELNQYLGLHLKLIAFLTCLGYINF